MENLNDDISQTAHTEGAGTTNPETRTETAQKRKTKALPPKTGETASQNGGGKSAESGENTCLDSSAENAGTGSEGDHTESTVIQAPETPQTEAERKRAEIAENIFSRGRYTTVYFTADLIPFGSKLDAVKQAAGLSDKTIIVYSKK